MSRIFTFSSCGFFLGMLTCLTMMIASTLTAQETLVKRWAPAPTISGDLTPRGQHFLSLLDDVTSDIQPDTSDYFSFVAQRQLNAPIDANSTVASKPDSAQSGAENQWAALLTYTCNSKTCSDCSTLTFTNSPSSGSQSCTVHSNSTCPASCVCCANKAIEQSSEMVCEQVSQLLATTLNSSQASYEAKRKAIESAMKMVADKALAEAKLQINRIRAAHQKEIGQLQVQLLQSKDQRESIDQIVSWLRPIYANHNRNYEQLQQLAEVRNPLPEFELPPIPESDSPRQFDSCFGSQPEFDRSQLPSSAQMASKWLAEDRKAEIAKLKQEIKAINARLTKLVDPPVQPATHLEPVYIPGQQLVPIHSALERHTELRSSEPAQRLKRTRRLLLR